MSDRVVVRIAQLAPALGDVPTNLERMLSAARDAAANGVDLLVFPELALTGYALRDHVPEVAIPLDSPEMNALREASRGVSIAFGFVEETPDHRFFNSAAYLEHGEIVHVHRKVHLPTYGLFEEGRYFASGESVRAFETRFGRFAMLVCEDVWHLPIPYLAALDGAIALLVLSAGPTRGLDHEGRTVETRVIHERPLTLFLNGQEIVTMMTIGDHPDYLAVGYLLNQNMLRPDDRITGIDYDEDLETVVVRTERATDYEEKLKKKVRTSGCAQGTVFGDLMEKFEDVRLPPDAVLRTSWLYALTKAINTCPSLTS